MSSTEKIKAEIERLKVDYLYRGYTFVPTAMQQLLNFIDSLPEEKPSYVTDSPGDPGNPGEPGISDLEEAAEEYADKHGFRVPYDGSNNYYDDVDVKASREGFLAGAEWQKDQMTKNAVEGYVAQRVHGELYAKAKVPKSMNLKFGDKVKIIIVKQ